MLGKVGGAAAVPSLIKALADTNKTVRGIAAQALGKIGDGAAADPLRELLRRESDPFVKSQADGGAGAALGRRRPTSRPRSTWPSGRSRAASSRRAPRPRRSSHDALARELGKLPSVTLSLSPADQHNFAKTGMLGLLHRRQHHPPRGRRRRAAPRRRTATSR